MQKIEANQLQRGDRVANGHTVVNVQHEGAKIVVTYDNELTFKYRLFERVGVEREVR